MTPSRSTIGTFTLAASLAASLAIAALPAVAQDRSYALEAVAVTGVPAPGTANFFQSVAGADLNDGGMVAVTGSAGEAHSGIWFGRPGDLSLVAQTGDAAPGNAAGSFVDFSLVDINAFSELLFAAGLDTGGTAPDQGLWSGPIGNLGPIARSGDPAPGAVGLVFDGFWERQFDDLGDTAFVAAVTLEDGTATGGIWAGIPGLLNPVAIPGDAAPGAGGLTYLVAGAISSDTAGTTLGFAGLFDTFEQGIWAGPPGAPDLIARAGDPAPGTGGRNFIEFLLPELGMAVDAPVEGVTSDIGGGPRPNRAGDVAFRAFVESADPRGDSGIWIESAGALSLVALLGDPAPGTAGLTFSQFGYLGFNAAGEVLFLSELDRFDVSNHGLWLGRPGSLGLLARTGDPAPGTDGETFAAIPFGASLNEAGQAAFFARLGETGAGSVWVGTPGNLALVVREGDIVEVAPGDNRTVQSITAFRGKSTALADAHAFNNAGQILIDVGFTDGASGVVLATPVTATQNQSPIADAGADATIQTAETATLDATGSSDPENGALTYIWSLGGARIATGPTPTVGPLAIGTHEITLTAVDELGASAIDSISLTVLNRPPVADAGPDRTIQTLETVVLDGTGSADPEGGALAYAWSLDGVQIAAGPTPTVGPFPAGSHTLTLTVTDDLGAGASDDMVLTVLNQAPLANAGPDRTVLTLETFALDGTGSSDPEGGALTYIWSLNGSQIGTGPTLTVGPFDDGSYAVTLTVTDDHGASATDAMVLTVLNRAPLADAGPDQTVSFKKGRSIAVALDGSASADPDGAIQAYVWTENGVVVGTGAMVQLDLAEGVYVYVLTVTDDDGVASQDTVVVAVDKFGGRS